MKQFTEREYLAALTAFEELDSAKISNLLCIYLLPSKIFKAVKEGDEKLNKLLNRKIIEKLQNALDDSFVKNFSSNLEKTNIKFISAFCGEVSEKLSSIFELAKLNGIYYKGDLSLIEEKSIAIVGKRMPDSYGKKVTEDFASSLTKAGLVIVSGLAAGVDSIAHNMCLKNGGKTIAVLGGGFNKIYPAFNAGLAEEIVKSGGLLISEYAPGISSNAYHFPVRNRIIAALSDAALITQMGEKSGANHTKNYAVDYGKPLYIVIADSYREASAGNLRLIEEMPECAVVTPARILHEFGLFCAREKKNARQLSIEEQGIVNCLKDGELHFDDIAEATGLAPGILLSLLTALKIDGIVSQLAGNFYSL